MVITGKETELALCRLFSFLQSAKFAMHIMERNNNNLLKIWRYYYEKVSGYYCGTRCDYRC